MISLLHSYIFLIRDKVLAWNHKKLVVQRKRGHWQIHVLYPAWFLLHYNHSDNSGQCIPIYTDCIVSYMNKQDSRSTLETCFLKCLSFWWIPLVFCFHQGSMWVSWVHIFPSSGQICKFNDTGKVCVIRLLYRLHGDPVKHTDTET